MKIVSWNVNGLRACLQKGFSDFFGQSDANIFCIQETKMQDGEAAFHPEGYHAFWNDASKKGYSGTAVFSRTTPDTVSLGMGIPAHDQEGRLITLEFGDCYLVNVYVPNAQEELRRLTYRMRWDEDFRGYLVGLDKKKPVIVCGDFNVAHQEIDLKNPETNRRHAGFTDEERDQFSALLDAGFLDGFRYLNPDARDQYTYWTYRFNARARNAGWRIDYGCISNRISSRLKEFTIHSDVMGSDHCPISFVIN